MLIGRVAERTGISARMLRHYDRIGLVRPSERSAAGYRLYSDDDLLRLFRVEGLRSLGLGLAEIPAVLDDEEHTTSSMVDRLVHEARARLRQAEDVLKRLEHVQASEPEAWTDVIRTVGLLRGFDRDDASARQRHALAVSAGDPRDLGVLVEAALSEGDPNAAGAIRWTVAQSGDRAVAALASALDAPEQERRRRALEMLEKLGTPAALAVVAAAVDHDDTRIRTHAQLARGRSGDPSAIPALVELVRIGDDDVEAADVLVELAQQGAPTGTTVVQSLALALTTADPASRRRLAAALFATPGPDATDALARLVSDPDPSVALTARAFLTRR